MSYTSQKSIEAYLQRTLSDDEAINIKMLIEAVDLFIGDQIGGSFGNTDSSTRYYSGSGTSNLEIDPVMTVTAINSLNNDLSISREYVLNTDYLLHPLNETIKTWIHARGCHFPCGDGNISVTGIFTLGADIPADLQLLATYLVSNLLSSAFVGNLKSESIEGYSRAFKEFASSDETVKLALNKYLKNEVLL